MGLGEIPVLLRQATLATLVSVFAVCGTAALAAVVALGLRFARRGRARFWLAPAYTILALVPLACGAAFWAAGVGRTAEAAALLDMPGSMAVRAGLAEAILPLLVASLATFGIASLALLLLAFGRRRDDTSPSPRTGTRAAQAAVVVLGVSTLALVLGVLVAAHAVEASYAVSLARALAWAGGALALVLFVAAFPLALAAPRDAAPRVPRALGLLVPAVVAGGGLLGAVAATLFIDAALNELPLPATPVSGLYEMVPPPPPPPPPSPQPKDASSAPPVVARAPGPRPATPIRVGVDIKEPRKLVHVPPRYPDLALQARVQGKVVLECVIGADGRVKDIEVKRGAPLLNDAARDAVRQWVYEPTVLNGEAVPVIMTVTVSFALR